ncbi:MAG: DUF192 domain-containing protein [Leptolyngbya sp. Prado105]|jgi:hypothetical protein|nr:DUF192 domain-containing protein [Leptolyngbya sp. Prado105]
MNYQKILLWLSLGLLIASCSTTTQAKPSPTQSNPPLSEESLSEESLGQVLPLSAFFQVGNQTIQLEVAKLPEEQVTGLMYRTNLADDRGMLFPFNPPRPTRFWMKNTLIPLDMLFLRNGTIQFISENVPPCKADPCPTYGPETGDIDQVIELRAGRAAELGLKVGDRLIVKLLQK